MWPTWSDVRWSQTTISVVGHMHVHMLTSSLVGIATASTDHVVTAGTEPNLGRTLDQVQHVASSGTCVLLRVSLLHAHARFCEKVQSIWS